MTYPLVRRTAAFTLVELLIVMGILMVIAAMAVPKIMTSVADVRLRAAIHSASGMIQQARMMAVKDNEQRSVKYINTSGGGFVYVDLDGSNSNSSNEPQVQLGSTVLAYSAPTGLAPLSATELSFDALTVSSLSFNSRGIPCTTVCGRGMVIYFTDSRTVGSPGWAAVSVSPAGRVKTWMWTGAKWGD